MAPPHADRQKAQSARLTKGFCVRAKQLADTHVQDMVRLYQSHLTVHNGVVDTQKWKVFKDKSPLVCYQRITKGTKLAPGQLPDFLGVGTLAGTVEDAMHGSVNLSPEAMQIESMHNQEDLVDTRILAHLVTPSVDDPFRSVTFKWVLKNHLLLSRHRDYVYVEATGMTTISLDEEEPVGYYFIHSLPVPGAPEFTKDINVIRGEISCCYLFRQVRPQHVELFCHGNLNPQGGVRARTALQIQMDNFFALPTSIQCGVMKKLAFALRTKPSAGGSGSHLPPPSTTRKNTITSLMMGKSISSDPGTGVSGGNGGSHGCVVCRRPVRSFFGKKNACELCDAHVCSRCRVTKKIYVFEEGFFHPAKMEFCSECIQATTNLSAGYVAAQELEFVGQLEEFDPETSNRSSSSQGRQSMMPRSSWDNYISNSGASDEMRPTLSTDFSLRESRVWLPTDALRRQTSIELSSVGPEDEDNDVSQVSQSKTEQRATEMIGNSYSTSSKGVFVTDDELVMIDYMTSGDEDDDDGRPHEVDFY